MKILTEYQLNLITKKTNKKKLSLNFANLLG